MLYRIAVLASEEGSEANRISTIVAWVLCILALIGIGIAVRRWL